MAHLRARSCFVVLTVIAAALALQPSFTAGPRFYPDDPLQREPESRDASGVKAWDIGLMYELAVNLYVNERRKPSNTRAQNVNTIDEVPDSSWFTNRIGQTRVTPEDLARGPNAGRPPAPEKWVIVREKSAGAQPGFTARDANGETWFVAFDEKARPQADSAAVVIATKIFWALGYNQVETFLTTFDPSRAEFDPKATMRRPSGERTPWRRTDLDALLEGVARNADGTYRVVAGRLLPGEILGGFRYDGTRPDDPNDIVPHQHRRELRALRVFGAWTNLTDQKGGNTVDTLVKENGKAIVKHYLQDVGSTFGTANGPHDWDVGWEHFYQSDTTVRRFLTFGFGLSPWQTVPYKEYPSVGKFEGDRFDPREWKPQTPTLAYVEMRADDAFWAARRVMAFSDDLIRAAVRTGQISDAAAESHLATVIGNRRDAIGRAYLPAINPIVEPRLTADGALSFQNAAVDAKFAEAPAAYLAAWSLFDNATGTAKPIAETKSATTSMQGPAGLPRTEGAYIEVDLSAQSDAHPSWREPIRTHFRRTANGWTLVGLTRLADQPGDAPVPAARDQK
ncbi:MAG TPA: hypothetical protein VFV95_21745 [Vicinamibacterales bacterium]|nr:hypothetical protein [Vicinamibacterales bacterium]